MAENDQQTYQNEAQYNYKHQNSHTLFPSGNRTDEFENELHQNDVVSAGATQTDDNDECSLSLSLALQRQAKSGLLVERSSNYSSTNVSEISDNQAISSYSSSYAWDHRLNLDLSISLCGT